MVFDVDFGHRFLNKFAHEFEDPKADEEDDNRKDPLALYPSGRGQRNL